MVEGSSSDWDGDGGAGALMVEGTGSSDWDGDGGAGELEASGDLNPMDSFLNKDMFTMLNNSMLSSWSSGFSFLGQRLQ
jgi:hypothetical protein